MAREKTLKGEFEVGTAYERFQFFRTAPDFRGDECVLCGAYLKAGNNSNNALAQTAHIARHIRAGLLSPKLYDGAPNRYGAAWRVLRDPVSSDTVRSTMKPPRRDVLKVLRIDGVDKQRLSCGHHVPCVDEAGKDHTDEKYRRCIHCQITKARRGRHG